MDLNYRADLRALTELRSGDEFEVVEVLFDTIRRLCPTMGVAPGDVLRFDGRKHRDVLLRRADGTHVAIDRFHASFVAVRIRGTTVKSKTGTPLGCA